MYKAHKTSPYTTAKKKKSIYAENHKYPEGLEKWIKEKI